MLCRSRLRIVPGRPAISPGFSRSPRWALETPPVIGRQVTELDIGDRCPEKPFRLSRRVHKACRRSMPCGISSVLNRCADGVRQLLQPGGLIFRGRGLAGQLLQHVSVLNIEGGQFFQRGRTLQQLCRFLRVAPSACWSSGLESTSHGNVGYRPAGPGAWKKKPLGHRIGIAIRHGLREIDQTPHVARPAPAFR